MLQHPRQICYLIFCSRSSDAFTLAISFGETTEPPPRPSVAPPRPSVPGGGVNVRVPLRGGMTSAIDGCDPGWRPAPRGPGICPTALTRAPTRVEAGRRKSVTTLKMISITKPPTARPPTVRTARRRCCVDQCKFELQRLRIMDSPFQESQVANMCREALCAFCGAGAPAESRPAMTASGTLRHFAAAAMGRQRVKGRPSAADRPSSRQPG